MPSATLSFPLSYTVLGQRFEKGVSRQVTSELAAHLLGPHFDIDWQGEKPLPPALIQAPSAESDEEGAAESTEGDEESVMSLAEAVNLVDVDDEAAFDADGKPSVAALSAIVGRDVTVEERDRAIQTASREMETSLAEPASKTRIIRRAKVDPSTEGAQEV